MLGGGDPRAPSPTEADFSDHAGSAVRNFPGQACSLFLLREQAGGRKPPELLIWLLSPA